MQAHADANQCQAGAFVGVVLAEEHVAQCERADYQQAERHHGGEREDRQHGRANRARERLVSGGCLKAGEMRQQRGLNRLKQLQWGARDQQHVEHDPR